MDLMDCSLSLKKIKQKYINKDRKLDVYDIAKKKKTARGVGVYKYNKWQYIFMFIYK